MKKYTVLSLALLIPFFGSFVLANDFQQDSEDVVYRSHRKDDSKNSRKADVIVQVQQRFYKFQNATSLVKRVAHDSNTALETAALDAFQSFLAPIPSFSYTLNDPGSFIETFTKPVDVRNAYQFFGSIFNSFSQHFSTDCVVDIVPGTNCKKAQMVSGGGEWAALLTTTCADGKTPNPNEQITISDFKITWVYLENGPTGPDWYIETYVETGLRRYSFCPPSGEMHLTYTYPFNGATCEPLWTSTICNGCTAECNTCGNCGTSVTKEVKTKNTKAK